MNHRDPTSVPSGAGRAIPCLALLLLPWVACDRGWARPVVPNGPPLAEPTPYLATIGSPALRFAEALPPPDLVTRPPAAAPPQPADAAATPKPDVIPFTPAVTESSAAATPDAVRQNPAPESVAGTPLPILPDELKPHVRAEDFLPYFEIPAANPGDPNVIVPVPRVPATPAPLPPSSATYTQSPR